MCPLLITHQDGLRCAANANDVRPFWGRALGWYGGALFGFYAVAVLGVFIFLRTIGYPVSIVHVGLPPLWHKVGQARGWFFLEKSNRAFDAGRTVEGLLYLENAWQFDPANYGAGLLLAKKLQAVQPAQSDKIFQQLLQAHPTKRHATAQEWFRALLARGSFEKVATLARDEIRGGSDHGSVWLRALLFAVRQTGDDATLRELIASDTPAVRPWRRVIETELLLRSDRTTEARGAIERDWPADAPAFALFYRASILLDIGDPLAALDLLGKQPGVLDAEATVTLRLDACAAAHAGPLLARQVNDLLAPRLTASNLAIVKILCAHLIRHPDAAVFERLYAKVLRDEVTLNTDTAGIWFSLLCAAGAVGDKTRLHELTAQLRGASRTPFAALGYVEAFFRGETSEHRITGILPVLPLPIEVTYALHERYGARAAMTVALQKRT